MNAELTPLLPNGTKNQPSNGVNKDKESNPDPEEATPKKEFPKEKVPTWSEMTQIITPYLKPSDTKHTFYAICALLSVILGKIVNALPPLAIRWAVDVVSSNTLLLTNNTTLSTIQPPYLPIAAFVGLKVLSMLISSLQNITQRIVTHDVERRFATACYSHLQSLSLSYHLEKHVGEITLIMSRGTDSVSTLINAFLFTLAPTLVEVLVVTAVFWKLGTPFIALSTIVSVFFYGLFTIVITNTRVKYRRAAIDANDNVAKKEMETLVHYETVTMFGRTNYEITTYGALRQILRDKRVDLISMITLLQMVQELIKLSGIGAGLVLAGYATVYNGLSAGSFVAVQLYINQLFQPLTYLGMTYRVLTVAFTDMEKVVIMLKREAEVKDEDDALEWKVEKKIDMGDASLQGKQQQQLSLSPSGEIMFDNVTFRYKTRSRRKALGSSLADLAGQKQGGGGGRGGGRGHGGGGGGRGMGRYMGGNVWEEFEDENAETKEIGGVTNISLRVPAGKTAALVGKSGSGKTTIIRLILRLYDADEGIVKVDSTNVRNLTQESLRSNIGVVAQETVLFNSTLKENIMYGKIDATEEEIWAAIRASALEEFVNKLPDGLDTLVGERGMKLSGGERQRVGLARCIIKNPQLILLDEATSALDSGTERQIQRNIGDICRGRTTVMIAHRLSTARNADEIFVLDDGMIVEHGTHDELLGLEGGRYARMWKDQMEPMET